MTRTTNFVFVLILTTITYFIASTLLFKKVNKTTNIVVDELFHLPQGKAFCDGKFSSWDPKITTLPGLHVSTAWYGVFEISCNAYNLRYINLLGSCMNFFMFIILLKFTYGTNSGSQTKIIFHSLNLALLPPLYFFSFVYYTDTLSLMTLLIFTIRCVVYKGNKWLIYFLGVSCLTMRQTNVVWIAMMLGHKVLDLLITTSRVYGNQYLAGVTVSKRSVIAQDLDPTKLKHYYAISDMFIALRYHLTTSFVTVFKFLTVSDGIIIIQQLLVLLTFGLFVYLNGSIVVGDKSAHEACIHIPQLFYFLLFYGVFGLPYVLAKLPSTLKLIFANKIKVILLTIVFMLIVHYNTLVHPYLLADNRHYTFYIWNRWFGKYEYAKYASVSVYIFLLFSLYDNLKDQNSVSFLVPYTICLILSLCLQRLVEIRYFLVPFIILRLRFVKPTTSIIATEFLWYVAINVVTFYIFFTKEIKWAEFNEAQRIMW